MTNILILGANGQIARLVTEMLLPHVDICLTLFLRQINRLQHMAQQSRERVQEGNVLDARAVQQAVQGQDVVYANLSGDMEEQARIIIEAMQLAGLKRLIFVSSMGIYNEIPGEQFDAVLDPYRNSVKLIEASDLEYTIVRPAWFNNNNEIGYGTTQKGEVFKNADGYVSRKSVADLIVKLITVPDLAVRQSLGVHKV